MTTDAKAAQSPFQLDNEAAFRDWRERKLADYPTGIEEMIVEVDDPRALTEQEHEAIRRCCAKANMAIYASRCDGDPDKDIPRLLAAQFGLVHLDSNMLADDDGITSLTVSGQGERADYIPYTNRPIRWHTDGYYNPPDRQIRGMVLHCVSPAADGGENALMDHEMAYLLMRDASPDWVRALMETDAMTIPARADENGVARPAESGPVFSVHPATGDLHMRYTARTRSIVWKDDAVIREAAAFLQTLLNTPSLYVYRATLAPGMGLICNNVLHDRTGFSDDANHRRLLYRARYYDRIIGTGVLENAIPTAGS